MNAQDLVRRIGGSVVALVLVGAGAPPTEDPFGSMQIAMSVAASAHENLPAFADAHSFRVTMTAPGRSPVFMIFDEDTNALKMTSPQPGSPTMYFVGGTMYSRSAGGAWTKLDARSLSKVAARTASAAPTPAPVAQRVDERVQRLPDRTVNGVRIGSFRMNKPARSIDKRLGAHETVTVTCFYEKANGRLRSCSGPQRFAMTFDRYDDPSNRFTLPSEALRAPDAFR